ncbi:PEGA domain-containing protein [Sorangium sp. So ce204]|uniref:PEGA domain-containing protein n=1 Tax=Sorangium sp. So ce204 TaxID=3133288 RepID=UPI003F63D0AE
MGSYLLAVVLCCAPARVGWCEERGSSTAMASMRYVEAEAELQSAWELNPTFDVAYNLGNTKYQLKKHREAAKYLSFALRNWPLVKTVAKLKPTAEQRFAESRAQVGAVTVTVSMAGAEVLVDGKGVGRAPLEGEVFVDPGEHRVEARHLDYEPASQTVGVAKGATAEVKLSMAMVNAAPQASAGVKMEGDGSAAGPTGGGPVVGQPPAPVEPPPPLPGKSWVPAIALGAASVVGLGVGIGTTVASNNANSEARAQKDQIFVAGGGCLASPSFAERCAELHRSGERAGLLGDVALGSYIASGVLAVAAVTYAVWPVTSGEKSRALLVLPAPRVDGLGVVMVSTW